MTAANLSKSQYIKGIQCPKNLWLYRNRKDLVPAIDAQKQALFDSGHEIGELAKQYLGGGVEVIQEYWDIEAAAEQTQKFIQEGHNTIYEATAINPEDGSYSKIDILHRLPGSNAWDLIEVKSSTSVKDYHIDDMSFQTRVFHKAGFQIGKCYMMVVNNTYVRQGDINPSELLRLEDITHLVLPKESFVADGIQQLNAVLAQDQEPDISIGAHCFAPFECDFRKYCWHGIPEYSFYDVFRKDKAEELAREYGSADLVDLPEENYPGGTKAIDIKSYLSGNIHVQPDLIRTFVKDLHYPLYYLDYETVGSAIPVFGGTRPFQQLPFQFSLHVQERPSGDLRHIEFLHKERSDPRLPFVKALIEACGQDGSIVTYNRAFEAGCNNELAKYFPEYAQGLNAITARMIDLLVPFKSRWLYHPNQNGSASIKAVLPAFTDLSYENMDIGNGADASLQYSLFLAGKLSDDEANDLWSHLSTYCHQDTYAMKVLLDVLMSKI